MSIQICLVLRVFRVYLDKYKIGKENSHVQNYSIFNLLQKRSYVFFGYDVLKG